MFLHSTKSTTASSLVALLVLSSGISARTLEYRLQCLGTDNRQIIDSASCGDKGSIAYCLGKLQPTAWDELARQVDTCYVNAGCSEAEAETEAVRALAHCDPAKDDADLRKRQGPKDSESESAPASNKPATTAKSGPKTTLVAATTAEAVTTSQATTPSTSPATTASTTPSSPTTTSPTTTAAPGPGLAHPGRPLVCFTTSLQSTTFCPIQSTGSSSGHALSCFPTTVPTSVCAAGLFCEQDDNGNASCMYAYTKFDTAGVVIAIFFAVAVTGAVALIATLCCRETRAHKRAEAAAIAAEANVLADKADKAEVGVTVAEVRGHGDDRRPLMNEDLGYGGGYAGGFQQQDAGPFADQHRAR